MEVVQNLLGKYMIISKTTFLNFLKCPKNAWLKIHDPNLLEEFTLSPFDLQLREQGNEVDVVARKLFPKGVLVTKKAEEGQGETSAYIKAKVPAIFQASFLSDAFLAKCDILEYDETNQNWNLLEVKASNAVSEDGPEEKDHVTDLAFQAIILRRAKLPIGKYFLIHINKEYIRWGDIDVASLFVREDISSDVIARMEALEPKMEAAKEYLSREKEPLGPCDCIYGGRSSHCETFQYSNPDIPKYGVHDIANIREKKLTLLMERKVYTLDDIPDDFDLTDNQWNQVHAHRSKRPIVDKEAIKSELDSLRFPLYFFDYEAFGLAIPPFDGYAPYKKIPFQYSLHVLREPGAKLEHFEFLHDENSDPTEAVIARLKTEIKPGGTVIAWSMSFEAGVNKDIVERVPSAAPFFEMVNSSLYDLRKIFLKQYYVHHGFVGKTSLKKVLPTLSEKRYDALKIQEGGQAVEEWLKMFSPNTTPAKRAEIAEDLKKYCGLDSIAMYDIWKYLADLVS